MKSWIMTFWLANHDKSEWPDLTICQTEDACHVTDTKNHPSKDVIEKMCSDEFYAKHKYKYVDVSSVTVKDDEDYDYSDCLKVGNSETNESLDISSEYQAAYSSPNPVERDDKFMGMNQEPQEPHDSDSGYLCPVAIEVGQRSDNEDHSSNQDTTEGFGSKRSHTEICQAEAVSRTPHETTYSQETKIKKRVVEYSNIAFSFDQDEASWDEDAECIPNYDTPPVAYENVVYLLDEAHTSQDEDTGFIAKRETCLDEYENRDDDGSLDGDPFARLYQNAAAFLTCTHPTASDQLVPQSDHLYANMQEKVDVVIQATMSQLGTDAGQPHIETRYQEQETLPQPDHARDDIAGNNSAGVSEGNPIAPSWLNDSKLEVTFYV